MADTTWLETSKSGGIVETQHAYVKTIVGVMLAADDDGFPRIKKTDADATPSNAITDYIVETLRLDTDSHAGRVFTYQKAIKLKAV